MSLKKIDCKSLCLYNQMLKKIKTIKKLIQKGIK